MADEKYTATLVRGENYVVANRSGRDDFTFPRGVPIVIDDALRAILEEAVDDVAGEVDPDTGEMEVFSKAKFAFDTYEGELAVGSIASGAAAAKTRKVIPATSPRRTKKAA